MLKILSTNAPGFGHPASFWRRNPPDGLDLSPRPEIVHVSLKKPRSLRFSLFQIPRIVAEVLVQIT